MGLGRPVSKCVRYQVFTINVCAISSISCMHIEFIHDVTLLLHITLSHETCYACECLILHTHMILLAACAISVCVQYQVFTINVWSVSSISCMHIDFIYDVTLLIHVSHSHETCYVYVNTGYCTRTDIAHTTLYMCIYTYVYRFICMHVIRRIRHARYVNT